jgi:hypothetical protein
MTPMSRLDPSPPGHDLDADLLAAAGATVQRFAATAVASAVGCPQTPPTATQMAQIVRTAEELGLLDVGTDSLGLWSRPGGTNALSFTLESLCSIAQVSAGAAYHLHQLALARSLAIASGEGATAYPVVRLGTGHPLQHRAVAALLAPRLGEPEHPALLEASFPSPEAEATWLFEVAEPWDSLLVPFSPVNGSTSAVTWGLVRREALQISDLGSGHGLGGLSIVSATKPPVVRPQLLAGDGRAQLRLALAAQSLAPLAMGLGIVRRALSLARNYAALRVQGGALIGTHAAVEQLLGDALAVEATVAATLASAALPSDNRGLARLVGCRATLQPRLCDAGNACMQVFGGLGYMQDAGVEGAVRDLNHLRVSSGAPETARILVTRLAGETP